MFDDDKKKIEELINDWVFMDEKKFFRSNKITSDFDCLLNHTDR